MTIHCRQENLQKALGHTERVVGRHSTLPILGNLLIETIRGRVSISATNLEVGVVSYIGAKIEREGKVSVPAQLLSGFIANIPNEDHVMLSEKKNTLYISSGGFTAEIKGVDVKEYPIIPQPSKKSESITLPAAALKKIIGGVVGNVATNETRPELMGVNILFSFEDIFFAATDSFRLAEGRLPLEKKTVTAMYESIKNTTPSLIIPTTALTELMHVISSNTSTVQVLVQSGQIFFICDDVLIVSRLIDGRYPDYKQIIPQEFSTTICVDRDAFIRALRIATTFSHQKTAEVSLLCDPQKQEMILTTKTQHIGGNTTKIKGFVEGEKQEHITLNPRYLLDGAATLNTTHIALRANNASSPIMLCEANEKGIVKSQEFLYVVMPIKNT